MCTNTHTYLCGKNNISLENNYARTVGLTCTQAHSQETGLEQYVTSILFTQQFMQAGEVACTAYNEVRSHLYVQMQM